MKSWKKPTPEQVSKAIALLGQEEQYRYFFDHLQNPEWLKPLWNKGFFKHPPKSEPQEESGTIHFPIWFELRYLVRAAAQHPKLVSDIMVNIPDTDNIQIHVDLVDAALVIPPRYLIKWINKEIAWLKKQNYLYLLLPEKFGELLLYLVNNEQADTSYKLAQALLDVLPDPKINEEALKSETISILPESMAKFDLWRYDRILKDQYPSLVKTIGLQALNLLCDLLEKAIKYSGDKKPPDDSSYIWRPAIEDHHQNMDHGVRTPLVTGIRNSTDFLVRNNLATIQIVVAELEKRPWKIFKRIALYILREFPEKAPTLVKDRLTKWDYFDDYQIRHEYFRLLGSCFKKLTKKDKNIILDWIEKNFDANGYKETWTEFTGKQVTEEEVKKAKINWQLKWLTAIEQSLSDKEKERFRDILSETGRPKHPDFEHYVESFAGKPAPVTAEELTKKSIDETIKYLQEWLPDPNQGPLGSDYDELGRVLSNAVSKEPLKFSTEAKKFKLQEPTYVRHFLHGLLQAINQKIKIEWKPVLELCSWSIEQEGTFQVKYHGRDPDWGWTRKQIAHLIVEGLESEDIGIPFKNRKSVWKIISKLLQDSNPTREYEKSYEGTTFDPVMLILNTVRGQALQAAVDYALWCAEKEKKDIYGHAFDKLPEVKEFLDYHLDLRREKTLTIRAVYGKSFPWLVKLDEQWAKNNVKKIFPVSNKLEDYRQTAWEAHVISNYAYDNVFDLLKNQYKWAITNIGKEKKSRPRAAGPDARLAQHLMVLYWRGKIKLKGKGSLLQYFWTIADDKLSAHALEYVGRSLSSTEGRAQKEYLDRMKKLWNFRLTLAKSKPGAHNEEMAAFGWWFISKKFEDKWALEQLEKALNIARKIALDFQVVERLSELVDKWPLVTVKCLEYIVDGDKEGWGIYGWQDHAMKILAVALTHRDGAVQEEAKNLINRLGAMGHQKFGQLLQRN